jgi:hypothetical protein
MKLVTLLASSAALAAIAVVVPATAPPKWNPVVSAEAATSVTFAVFYDRLADHGDWIDHDGDYVFVPVVSDPDWRPYREGHWIYASSYGWTWVSDEPFGWATYHYGRWGFDEEIGWYWIPGTKWAPAWVSWRRSGDHVAWAPLPPRRGGGDDVTVVVSVESIPEYYWVAVPTRSFLEVNLSVVIIDDDRERRRIVNDSEFVGSVNIENNIVVNNVIDVNFVEKNTGKQVKEVAVKETNDPAAAKASDNEVAVFNGTVEPDKSAKPGRLKDAGEVKQNQAENKQKIQSETGGEAAAPTEGAPDAEQAAQPGDKKKKLTPEQAEGQAPEEAPATEQAAQPDNKKKKKVTPEQAEGQATEEAPATEQAAQPDNKKKKKLTPEQAEGQATEEAPATEQAAQPDNKKKKKLTPEQAEGQTTEEAPATEQAAQPDNKKKKKLTPEQAEGAASDDMPVGSITKPDQKADKKKSDEPAAQKAAPCDPAAENCENPQQ